MIIATENTNIKPITITLTTQAEIGFFYNLLSTETISHVYGVEDEADYLLDALSEQTSFEAYEDCSECSCEDYFAEVNTGSQRIYPQQSTATNTLPETVGPLLVREHPCKSGCEACVGCNACDSTEHQGFEGYAIKVETEGFARLIADVLGAMQYDIAKEKYGLTMAKLDEIHRTAYGKAYGSAYVHKQLTITKYN